MNVNQTALAHASAVCMAVVYLVCGFSIALIPGITKTVTQSWFHGLSIESKWSGQPFQGNFVLGLVSAIVLTWLLAYSFGYLYNAFIKK